MVELSLTFKNSFVMNITQRGVPVLCIE